MWLLPLLLTLTCAVDTTDDRRGDLEDAIASYAEPLGLEWDPSAVNVAWVDLNRDGLDDAVVLLKGPDWCGSGGCTVLVFEQMDALDAEEFGRFRPAAEISMVSGPVMAVRGRGYWSDLVVPSPHGPRRLRFNGETYPTSPAAGDRVQGRMPHGTVLFADRL
ncbi:hypothetical protein [Rubrivirga sp.]|uniref:hypothetical protein n=1 Tax=Rubrivirga sp. TaxID=1885344 RepID=UPI003B529E1F